MVDARKDSRDVGSQMQQNENSEQRAAPKVSGNHYEFQEIFNPQSEKPIKSTDKQLRIFKLSNNNDANNCFLNVCI